MIAEPDVALTDWALAMVAGVCAWRLRRRAPLDSLHNWLVVFFGVTAVAAFLGGLVHGFFPNVATWGGRLLWLATLVCVGLIALSAWAAGALLILRPSSAPAVITAAAITYVIYGALIVLVAPVFSLALAHYLPAALFLLVALARAWMQTHDPRVLEALLGLATLLVGSVVQWRGIALHPIYFTHNALYHLIAVVGLVLLFRGSRRLTAGTSSR